MLKFFRLPFATTGDKTAVPDAVDSNGNVSYSQGYGFDYQRQKTDPAAKNIERDKMNQIFFDVTTAIAELQSQGIPDFISSALNGGAAYSYSANALVRYSGDVYVSLVDANTATPTDATKWALAPTPARVRDGKYTVAASAGTADAILLTLTPTQTAFASGPIFWRATGMNTSATPTVKRDGLAAKTLVKGANLPLTAGDIPGAGAWMASIYDASLDKEVLLNPWLGSQPSFSAILSSGNFTTGPSVTPSTVFCITLIGGGAGGGGSAGANGCGGGGGAGGAAKFYITGLTANTSYPVVIGAGGTGGTSAGGNGGTGGTTQITINGTVYSATGGVSGTGSTASASGVCVSSGQGSISASVSLQPNLFIYQNSGGIGWANTPLFVGSNGAGLSPYGTGGIGGRTGAVPVAGVGFGAGGGGGVGPSMAGGDGRPGVFIAEWSVK